MQKIGIVTSGFLPVPATKGGAVENLICNILSVNEERKEKEFYIFSVEDKEAIEESQKYKFTKFIFIKISKFAKIVDKLIYFISKCIFKKSNSHSYRFIIQRLEYLKKVSKLLKKNDYDKIILENHPTQYLALKFKKNFLKYKGKYYYHCHNEFVGEYSCKSIIEQTKNILCVSEYIKNKTMKALEMEEDKFVVFKNCVDESKFKRLFNEDKLEELKRKYNIRSDEVIFIFTGRIVPEKGVLELVKAIKLLKNCNFKLFIIGSSLNALKSKSKYEEEVENNILGLEDRIIFTGFIEYDKINLFYHIANVAIIPSIWNDPAPLTVIESITMGLPIITTNSGGIPEYVNSKCAIILDRNNELSTNIAKSMKYLIENKKEIEKMSKESNKLSKEMSKQIYYNRFIDILK